MKGDGIINIYSKIKKAISLLTDSPSKNVELVELQWPTTTQMVWHDAKSDPPPRNSRVIVCCSSRIDRFGERAIEVDDFYKGRWMRWSNPAEVTHWMPLPPLPKK